MLRLIYIFLLMFLDFTPALGASKSFWSTYHLGISYDISRSYAAISYNAPSSAYLPDDCQTIGSDVQQMRCTAYLGPSSEDRDPSLSLYLSTPFVRQGWLYFDYGLSFATLSYKGGLVYKSQQVSAKQPFAGNSPKKAEGNQPLDRAYLELYGINWQSYLQFGITPRYLPDLLITTGIAVQTVAGRVKILKQDEVRWLAQPDAFIEAELVVLRGFSGSLSMFVGQDSSFSSTTFGRIADDHVGGSAMTDFKLELSSASAGINLLLPF